MRDVYIADLADSPEDEVGMREEIGDSLQKRSRLEHKGRECDFAQVHPGAN
jgi:hypothetical protein